MIVVRGEEQTKQKNTGDSITEQKRCGGDGRKLKVREDYQDT